MQHVHDGKILQLWSASLTSGSKAHDQYLCIPHVSTFAPELTFGCCPSRKYGATLPANLLQELRAEKQSQRFRACRLSVTRAQLAFGAPRSPLTLSYLPSSKSTVSHRCSLLYSSPSRQLYHALHPSTLQVLPQACCPCAFRFSGSPRGQKSGDHRGTC